jgi:tetratricopeptide (TPR) repeat protein
MAEEKFEEQELSPIETKESNQQKAEDFFEKNKNVLVYVLGGILAIVAGFLGWQKFIIEPREKDARENIWSAERYFEKDSLNLAINGDGNYPGFEDIIDDYGMTQSANLAQYYLGITYLKKGEFETAIEHLEKFDSDDQMVSAIALGAIGDANLELGKNEDALDNYLKAANKVTNDFTTPIFLMKAAVVYEEMENYEGAMAVYEQIKDKFPKTREAQDAPKYLARAKAMAENK